MIDVVIPDTYSLYTDELDAMHRLRYDVFSVRLGWQVEVENGREYDQFDELDPTYFLAIENGSVVATWRLLPTMGPYMLRDIFPELLDGEQAPESPTIFETSRFAVHTDGDAEQGLACLNKATGELFCGLLEYGLAAGIEEVWTVYDIRIARLLKRLDCTPLWRSKARRIGETLAVAGRFEISNQVLARIRAAAGIDHPMLRQRTPMRERRLVA